MEENKTEQYTFGADEKEILEILGSFENDYFGQKQQDEQKELQTVKYYECFETAKGEIYGVFMTQEQDADGNVSYHLYFQSPSNEILSIDNEGKITMNPEWEKVIGYIDFEKYMYINDREEGRLKGISEKTTPEEIQEKLEKKKDDKEEQTEDEKEEEKPEEQIQKDIGGQEDLDIGYYRPIKDQNFGEQIGMNLSGYEEIGLAYSKTKNAFILVGKKDGQFQQVEGFKLAQPTYKTVMSIDEKGEKVEKEVPHAIMQTNNPKKELSITIGQYGYIEVGTIDRLPCDERVKRQVGEQGEGEQGRTSAELNRVIREEGTEGLHKWAHENDEQHEQMEQGEERQGNIAEEISEGNDEYIPETNVRWRDFANECGYRDKNGIEYAKKIFEQEKQKNPDKTNQELAEQIPEEKLEDTPFAQRNQ